MISIMIAGIITIITTNGCFLIFSKNEMLMNSQEKSFFISPDKNFDILIKKILLIFLRIIFTIKTIKCIISNNEKHIEKKYIIDKIIKKVIKRKSDKILVSKDSILSITLLGILYRFMKKIDRITQLSNLFLL